ncbi:MAG: HAMP domain-containing sensor histidine kinase [Candidatus Binatia bacterium]
MDSRTLQPAQLDKKHTVILLRSVVVISTSYLIIFGEAPQAPASIAYIIALLLTNVALALTPGHWFHQPAFSAGLLLGDTAVVLVGLYMTVGCFSQDFLIIYFFTIFLTTATSSLAQIAVGAAMVSGLYGYWLFLTAEGALGAGQWLRLPFFFIVAVFYAFMTEETKRERYARERAERESERLRLLVRLGGVSPRPNAADELVRHIGSLIQSAFPRLVCDVGADPFAGEGGSAVFALRAGPHNYGALRVRTTDGSPLWPNETAFCTVAASIAANALHSTEQAGIADDGARMREAFLSTLSHELRTPLHVILGNAEILNDLSVVVADPLARESVERLRANACRLLDLIQTMLCFAELRAGETSVALERVDLRAVFDECRANMRERLAGRPIRFAISVADGTPLVYTDARKLRLLLDSLLSNAAKFTETGFVELSAQPCAAGVEIAVRDSGIGIDPQDVSRIFQDFHQLDQSLTRPYQGLGLGLALARELASVLGGSVDVESAPAHGSTFRVRLPIAPVRQPRATARPLVSTPALVAVS